MENQKSNPLALIPIGVFLVLYLGLGILFDVCGDRSIFAVSDADGDRCSG